MHALPEDSTNSRPGVNVFAKVVQVSPARGQAGQAGAFGLERQTPIAINPRPRGLRGLEALQGLCFRGETELRYCGEMEQIEWSNWPDNRRSC